MLPDVDTGSPSGSMPTGGVEFGAAGDGSREATPVSSEDKTTTKRRSTEKLLGQVRYIERCFHQLF